MTQSLTRNEDRPTRERAPSSATTSNAESTPHVSSPAAASLAPLIRFAGIGKNFGNVQALVDIDVAFHVGECVGVAGHNGAGKSTLMSILAGVYPPSAGHIEIDGQHSPHYDAALARRAGVRCVFQELSLCANLSVAENMCVAHPSLSGRGWRRRAAAAIRHKLDDIFPDHGIGTDTLVSDLTLTQRQMVEIARAFTQMDGQERTRGRSEDTPSACAADAPVRVIILDEPTSSLDAHTSDQLLRYVRKAVGEGITCLLVTHMLGEIEQVADRVMVMRDGKLIRVLPREAINRDAIIVAMGQQVGQPVVHSTLQSVGEPVTTAANAGAAAMRSALTAGRASPEVHTVANAPAGGAYTGRFAWEIGKGKRGRVPLRVEVGQGEVVGFGGLAGQGQTEALLAIYDIARGGPTGARSEVAFVAGDRPRDGIFPVWSIAQNLDIRWLAGTSTPDIVGNDATMTTRARGTGWLKGLLIDFVAASAIADTWRVRIGIRGAAMNAGILSLSGGNQQKVLFARALASNAQLILMDDPTRGVDVGTKRDIYTLVRDEAAKGRTFIWYTTENDELAYCDRTFVFRAGQVNRVLNASECTEDALLSASFEERTA